MVHTKAITRLVLATLAAAALNDRAAAPGPHTGAEPVGAGALSGLGLVSALHQRALMGIDGEALSLTARAGGLTVTRCRQYRSMARALSSRFATSPPAVLPGSRWAHL